jgi:hypothetical protein
MLRKSQTICREAGERHRTEDTKTDLERVIFVAYCSSAALVVGVARPGPRGILSQKISKDTKTDSDWGTFAAFAIFCAFLSRNYPASIPDPKKLQKRPSI